jgi:TctA family transporter
LLAFSIFGLSMVSALSGSMPLRGLSMAGFGILLSMVGGDPQTGQERWTFDTLYLVDDLPLLPVALGLFALPEICDVAARRTAISDTSKYELKEGMLVGLRDVFKNWWLVAKCGSLGAMIGAIPGLGSAVVDWFAYGYAAKSIKDADKTFGKGDVRGVKRGWISGANNRFWCARFSVDGSFVGRLHDSWSRPGQVDGD